MSPEEIQEIQRLAQQGTPLRAIAHRFNRDVKTIRRIVNRPTPPKQPSKLEPFRAIIEELARQNLFAPRILREIRERGYSGSLSLLKDYLRKVRGPKKESRTVVRRFETKPGIEAQVDWSPYRIGVGGVETVVHCFSMVLCYSRYMFIRFYRNERLPTLLHAHVQAFEFFSGIPDELHYDNQTTVTLGRLHGKPLWNPNFLPFVQHMGFKPFACQPGDHDREGKVERPFWYIETDFVRATRFDSWEDLNQKGARWLDETANRRKHGTTHRRVNEMFVEEKPFLTALPKLMFATDRREPRKVQADGYIPVDGSLYPVPGKLVGQYVTVRIYPERIEVTDAAGKVVAAHPVPDRPTRLPPLEPPPAPSVPSMSRPALESAFLARFPDAEEFLDGLKRRMNALTPIHLLQIHQLVHIYTEPAAREAILRAQTYGNFSATAIRRILQTRFPNVVEEPAVNLMAANPAALGALDDVDSGSPADYTIDSVESTKGDSDVPKE